MKYVSGCLGAALWLLPALVFAAEPDSLLFPRPAALRGAIDFWKQVFGVYSTNSALIHDNEDLRIVYGVEKLSPGGTNRQRQQAQEAILGRYRRAMERLAEGRADTARLSEEEQRVWLCLGRSTDPQRYRRAGETLRLQVGQRDRFEQGLEVWDRHGEEIRRILRAHGVPDSLAVLPFIESGYNPRAHSRVGASGLWQIMKGTGRPFLQINRRVDERRDPFKATAAAAQILRRNYRALGNWPLAITAYNHGREGMLRAIAEVGSRDLMEIIRRYQGRAFGFASKSFYAEFLAALEVARRSDELFPNLEYHRPFPLGEIELGRSISIAALLKPTGTSQEQFHEWNPALSAKVKDIPSGYRIKVPADKLEIFLAAYQGVGRRALAKTDVPLAKGDAVSWIRHQVAPGETLSQIAESYQTSVGELQRVNGLGSAHLIAAGQHLKVRKR